MMTSPKEFYTEQSSLVWGISF